MLNRRDFLVRSLYGSSLLAMTPVVPQFLVNTARAAEAHQNNILVVVEMSGGNDGLNTVIPYTDDLYHKYRPTLRFNKDQVVKVNDAIGLHPAMGSFNQLLQKNELAVVQGVGYPNPDRSHFESMDIWQSADPKRRTQNGWLARSAADLQDKQGNVPLVQVGPERLPLALRGATSGVASINNPRQFRLDLGNSDPMHQKARKRLLEDLAKSSKPADPNGMLQFVQRRQLQTYASLERLQDVVKDQQFDRRGERQFGLFDKLQLVARLIGLNFGARVFYVSIDGFDTHSNQGEMHRNLLAQLANSITSFFNTLRQIKQDNRVVLMTFSEFGRRVQENGSRGTDHGSGSSLFVAGPAVKGGVVGKHPSLKKDELDYEITILDKLSGDLKYHTDFRRIYASLLDNWLHVDSKTVLAGQFEHMDLLKAKV